MTCSHVFYFINNSWAQNCAYEFANELQRINTVFVGITLTALINTDRKKQTKTKPETRQYLAALLFVTTTSYSGLLSQRKIIKWDTKSNTDNGSNSKLCRLHQISLLHFWVEDGALQKALMLLFCLVPKEFLICCFIRESIKNQHIKTPTHKL